MGRMLTKLIFPLPGNKVHCAVFFLPLLLLAVAGGLPPHPLSPTCQSFVLTNGCVWYQTVAIGLVHTHRHI